MTHHPYLSLDMVADNGIPHFLCQRYADPGFFFLLVCIIKNKAVIDSLPAFLDQFLEFFRLFDPVFLFHRQSEEKNHLAVTLSRQDLSSLSTTSCQNFTSADCCHASSEAMVSFTFPFAWLVCSLHSYPPPILYISKTNA